MKKIIDVQINQEGLKRSEVEALRKLLLEHHVGGPYKVYWKDSATTLTLKASRFKMRKLKNLIEELNVEYKYDIRIV